MKMLAFLPVIALLAAPSIAAACNGKKATTATIACADHAQVQQASTEAPMCDQEKATVAMASIQDVAKWTKAHKVTPVDANGSETRAKMGVIPGARLLTSSTQYDAKELPADKTGKLVFYCANTRCQASHQAAARALGLGYTDVNVLPVGIKGWVEAGQATEKPAPQS